MVKGFALQVIKFQKKLYIYRLNYDAIVNLMLTHCWLLNELYVF